MEKEKTQLQIRCLIRQDMGTVLRIERACFEWAWSEEDFLRCLRQRNCIGVVACEGRDVVGFMVYEMHKSRLHILNLAVGPDSMRCGVGRQMVERLQDKLSHQRRREITLEVRETNLAAQLFFRSQGFRAVRVLRDYYDGTDEDAYVMRCLVAVEPDGFEATDNLLELVASRWSHT